MSCVGGCWFSPRETKLQSVCDVSLARACCPATDKATNWITVRTIWGAECVMLCQSCRKITHHRSALWGRQKAEENSGSRANKVHNNSLLCWESGTGESPPALSLSTRWGSVGMAVWHTDTVFVSKSRSIHLALQLHHKSSSSQNWLHHKGRAENIYFWLAGRCHLKLHTRTAHTYFQLTV